MGKEEPYHFVRFRWASSADLDLMEKELAEYVVGWRTPPKSESLMQLHKENLRELKLKADTLNVFMSHIRAVLFQLEHAPFTPRDMELRTKVFRSFPRERPTPFPFFIHDEPHFEIQGEASS